MCKGSESTILKNDQLFHSRKKLIFLVTHIPYTMYGQYFDRALSIYTEGNPDNMIVDDIFELNSGQHPTTFVTFNNV